MAQNNGLIQVIGAAVILKNDFGVFYCQIDINRDTSYCFIRNSCYLNFVYDSLSESLFLARNCTLLHFKRSKGHVESVVGD